MSPELSSSTFPEKTKATHAALIEASCAPMFGKIKDSLGLEITSERILQFAEAKDVKNNAVQLAVHICEILLSGIRDEQNENAHIHTTEEIREKIRHITQAHQIQSSELVSLYRRYDLPLVIDSKLFKLAKEFLEIL